MRFLEFSCFVASYLRWQTSFFALKNHLYICVCIYAYTCITRFVIPSSSKTYSIRFATPTSPSDDYLCVYIYILYSLRDPHQLIRWSNCLQLMDVRSFEGDAMHQDNWKHISNLFLSEKKALKKGIYKCKIWIYICSYSHILYSLRDPRQRFSDLEKFAQTTSFAHTASFAQTNSFSETTNVAQTMTIAQKWIGQRGLESLRALSRF